MRTIQANIPWKPILLPPDSELESRRILKKLPAAHRALAELKGIGSAIPNQTVLLNTLGLQEGKDSSAVENIISTQDELFTAELNLAGWHSAAAKEVQNLAVALKTGFILIAKSEMITANYILKIQSVLENNDAGYRRLPGTVLKNIQTREVVYHSLLQSPVLYLSRYIIDNKNQYYQLLQNVREKQEWEPWILFMLDGIEQTSLDTIFLILEIKKLMMDCSRKGNLGWEIIMSTSLL